MEKTYDITTTCKASWIINKILWWDTTINNCWYYYRLKLNDGTRDYVIRWLEKNDIWFWTWCENNFYAFSWWQLPKVGDEMFVVAQYNDAWIIEQGKNIYNQYSYLPNCPVTADWDPSYDAYLWADKCKVSWTIENINRTFTDTCWLNLWIKVENGWNTYIIWWREYFTWKWISLCLWNSDWWLPIDITNWKVTKNINKGDSFYAIIDTKDNTILKYWENNYNNADNSIPSCNVATEKQIETFTWWLNENQIKQIMDGVEKELIKTYPDFNDKPVIDKVELINNSSWIISNTIKNPEEKITKNITSNNINSWTILETQTWSNTIKEPINLDEIEKNINIINTWSIQALEQNQVQVIKYQSNYIIFWILLIFLLIIFFYKILKIKK